MWNQALRCVLRSVSSPDPRHALALLSLSGALLAGALACSRDARSVRLPALSPGDEIYRISCERSITACREEAAEVCGPRYEVLESAGAPVEPVRVSSAPGPSSTGPRYQRKKWVGHMVIACGRSGAPALSTQPGTGAAPSARAPAPERLCVPGVTQECLGPGACRGAQACASDGNGYGPCDCGNASTAEQSSPARDLHDAGAGAPGAGAE